MRAKEKLRDGLELQPGQDLMHGKNVDKSLVTEDGTIAFVDKSVDKLMGITQNGVGDVDRYSWYEADEKPVGVDGDDYDPFVVEFGRTADNASSFIRASKIKRIADAVNVSPDNLLHRMDWWMAIDGGPVGFDIRTEGWVVVSPLLKSEDAISPIEIESPSFEKLWA